MHDLQQFKLRSDFEIIPREENVVKISYEPSGFKENLDIAKKEITEHFNLIYNQKLNKEVIYLQEKFKEENKKTIEDLRTLLIAKNAEYNSLTNSYIELSWHTDQIFKELETEIKNKDQIWNKIKTDALRKDKIYLENEEKYK